MCFNAPVSITTYIVGIIGCIILLKKKYTPEAAFFLVVIQMQLIEFFLWKNQSCNSTNIFVTKLGIAVNHMEPVVFWLAILFFSEKKLPKWINYTMILYILAALFYTMNVNNTLCTTVTPESSPHLYWKWNDMKYKNYFYVFFLFTLIALSITGLKYGYHMAIIVLLSFIISYIVYGKYKSTGAMWCFIAAAGPLIIPYFYKIKLFNLE